jgi:uncharacterized protein
MPDRGPNKPSPTEDDFFAREDVEKKRKLAQQVKKQLTEEERKRLRDLHHMHCPRCGMGMQEVHFGKIDVDVCFSCNGAFLDRSEIEVIAAPQQKGIMAAILNWFREETHHPVK